MANTLRLEIFLLLLCCLTLIPAEPSDEVKVEAAPPPASSSSSPPPVPDSVTAPMPDPGSTWAPPNNSDLPRQIGQEKDPGKAVLGLAISIAMGVLTVGKNDLYQSEIVVLILVSLGFTAILCGIQVKGTFPEFARMVEALGIGLVAISFFSTVARFLPPETSWVPLVCMGLCLLPLGIAVWRPS